MAVGITKFSKVFGLSFAMAAASLSASHAGEIQASLENQTSVAVTIYNNDLALVKDQRKIVLSKGDNALAFRGVSARIRPETAMLRSLDSGSQLDVLEQNFDYDLLTPAKLLDKYVGQNVTLVSTNPATGNEKREKATVLSTAEGVVLRIGDRIEVNPKGRFVFDDVPSNLRDKPTLVVSLDSSTAGAQTTELSYLTGGLSWKADYIAELNADDSQLDLVGFVTLKNNSGATYQKAKMQLVAGDVNRVQPRPNYRMKNEMIAMADMAAAPRMVEESLFDYHLYTLNRPTTIADKQTKQVSLLNGSSIPVTKEYLLQGQSYFYQGRQGSISQGLKIGVFVSFDNKDTAGLGVPLPKGIVRVYKRDSAGNAQFVGEDSIDHTPKDESVKLKLGNAFDVTASRKQIAFSSQPVSGHYRTQTVSEHEVTLKNHKDDAVTITLKENLPGEWKVLDENLKHTKLDARTAQWKIPVPANGETTLKYRVQTRY